MVEIKYSGTYCLMRKAGKTYVKTNKEIKFTDLSAEGLRKLLRKVVFKRKHYNETRKHKRAMFTRLVEHVNYGHRVEDIVFAEGGNSIIENILENLCSNPPPIKRAANLPKLRREELASSYFSKERDER